MMQQRRDLERIREREDDWLIERSKILIEMPEIVLFS